jgi:hypothetical protein
VTPRRSHPAAYPKYILDRLGLWLGAERRARGRALRILDPMAGVGRIHDLPRRLGETVGVELEAEWAECRKGTLVGDATALPEDWSGSFDAVVVSPVYGNRMSDHHDAKDSCAVCQGIGTDWAEEGCGDAPFLCPECHSVACACGGIGRAMREHVGACSRCRSRRCKACGGSGLSKRYTYRAALGRMPSPGSAAVLHWPSSEYRTLHKAAWSEAHRVLGAAGMMLVNVKNHLRDGAEQFVTEWHMQTLQDVGFRIEAIDSLPAVGIRHGDNSSERVANEQIIVGRRIG